VGGSCLPGDGSRPTSPGPAAGSSAGCGVRSRPADHRRPQVRRAHPERSAAAAGVRHWRSHLVPGGVLAEAQERARLAELTRDEEARLRVQEERIRIARELHDIVGHSLSIINVQAGVAGHVIGEQPEVAEKALEEIRQVSSSASKSSGLPCRCCGPDWRMPADWRQPRSSEISMPSLRLSAMPVHHDPIAPDAPIDTRDVVEPPPNPTAARI
jgi:Histidine kinase